MVISVHMPYTLVLYLDFLKEKKNNNKITNEKGSYKFIRIRNMHVEIYVLRTTTAKRKKEKKKIWRIRSYTFLLYGKVT